MTDDRVYWTTKNGEKIDIDQMTESHLRNTLKLIVRRGQEKQKIVPFSKSEVNALTKNRDANEWMWK